MNEREQQIEYQEVPETTYTEGFLFHGAMSEVSFDAQFDYSKPGATADASATLGDGLYLTDKPDVAVNYSSVRQGRKMEKTIVYSVYAPDCKFLDFRGENENILTPVDIIRKWYVYYKAQFLAEVAAEPDIGPESEIVKTPGETFTRKKINWKFIERENKWQYIDLLEQVLSQNMRVDLRQMLGVDKIHSDSITSNYDPHHSPYWIGEFRTFVMDILDYDGIIYDEAGEGENAKEHSTFIIYNLEKIVFSRTPLEQSVIDTLVGK